MRKRKSKNLIERTEKVRTLIVNEPEANKGRWKEFFGNNNPIYMEMGCGKGKFIVTQALENPSINFLAVEGEKSVVLMAMELAKEKEVKNLKFITSYIFKPEDFFENGEIHQLYLNFSDPWPKARHEKRRLTGERYLRGYEKILKKDGIIEFKTDNLPLFEFSLEQIQNGGYPVLAQSFDLHNSDLEAKKITTEYEEKFKARGNKINYVKFVVGK